MMRRPKNPKPTDSECLILNVLWQKKSATVREVFEHLEESDEGMGYTTVLKFMQIMTEKKLLERDSSVRAVGVRGERRGDFEGERDV